MSHRTANFALHRGRRKTLDLTLLGTTGNNLDLSASKVTFKLSAESHTPILLTKSSTAGTSEITASSTAGEALVEIQETDFTDLKLEVYFFKVDVTDVGENLFRALDGYITLEY